MVVSTGPLRDRDGLAGCRATAQSPVRRRAPADVKAVALPQADRPTLSVPRVYQIRDGRH